MKQAGTIEELGRHPIGRWAIAGSSVVWCASPELCGCIAWGTPAPDDVMEIVGAFESFRHPSFAPRFDVVLDARRLVAVPPGSLELLVRWIADHREELARRVRLQIGVIPAGIVGITMSGILPVLGTTHAFEITHDAEDAFVRIAGGHGRALLEELEAISDGASGTPAWLVALRGAIRSRPRDVTLDQVARRLGMSRRTLQRLLREHATSFQDELARGRFEVAREALATTDVKVDAIAREVGISARSLSALVRRHAGCAPSELRRLREVTPASGTTHRS